MARRRKPKDTPAAAAANEPQAIPPGPVKADFGTMMPGYPRRHDGWNQQRLQRFLDALAHTGCVEDAARVAGMSDVAPYRAKKRYPLFAAAWEEALARSRQGLIAIAYRRAVEGRETIIIRKGEEVERRIQPSDSMLGLLIKRGDMAGEGAGPDADKVLTFAEWQAHWVFDAHGNKVQGKDPAIAQAEFAARMEAVRRRVDAFAAERNLCPSCSQPWPEREGRSMAELVAAGVVDGGWLFGAQ